MTEAGLEFRDVVDLTVYLVDVESDFEAAGKVAQEYLSDPPPVMTLIGVKALARPNCGSKSEPSRSSSWKGPPPMESVPHDDALLEVRDVVSGYQGKTVLRGISCKVGRGEIVSLIGPNGAGKSTLLLTVLGYVKAEAGEIRFRDQPIMRLQTNEIIRLGIAFCTQGRTVFPDMTVNEHLDLGAWTVKDPVRKKTARARVLNCIRGWASGASRRPGP